MQAVKFINRKVTPEYMAYVDARRRCKQPSRKQYRFYGGRGIKFLFTDFDEFYSVLGKRPEKHSLDRIDNNGHYSPDNVKWSTQSEQNKNRRKEILNKCKALTWLIETPDKSAIEVVNMSQFCIKNGLCRQNLHVTLKTGWKHKGYRVMKKLKKTEVIAAYQAQLEANRP
jgi:hypothetical protein